MLKKILLLSASSGAGHIRAAQAIEKAFKEADDESGLSREVRHVDTLKFTNRVFRHLYRTWAAAMPKKMADSGECPSSGS